MNDNSKMPAAGTAELYQSDCVRWMRGVGSACFDAVVTDPPYGYEFMGEEWDTLAHPVASSSFGGFSRDRGDGRVPYPSFERVRRHLRRMQQWHRRWAAEAFRLLKPGGYLVAFGGCRTHNPPRHRPGGCWLRYSR